ncbi:30S ribosomal protein S16 [Candidatus Collierbacteria bacterium]|nr:30S ribosomal protein S16 [Candidatus Collierbacteria bacterium]
MLKIKLSPTGKKNDRHYRIVVSPDREKLQGKFIDLLGTYHPRSQEQIKLNKEAYQLWLKKGAQPTPTVKQLVAKIK